MERIQAIEISNGLVTSCLLEVNQRVAVAVGFGSAVLGDDLAGAIGQAVHAAGGPAAVCRVAVGAEYCYIRNLTLPFNDRTKAARILPFELEELTSHQLGRLQLDFLLRPVVGGSSEVLAVMVERAWLAELLAALQGQGLDPELVTVAGLALAAIGDSVAGEQVLLDLGPRQATLVVTRGGVASMLRVLPYGQEPIAGQDEPAGQVAEPERLIPLLPELALAVQQTLLGVRKPALLEPEVSWRLSGLLGLDERLQSHLAEQFGRAFEPSDASEQRLLKLEPQEGTRWQPGLWNGVLALAARPRKQGQLPNFRSGDFRKRPSLARVSRFAGQAAAALGLAAVLAVGYCWWDLASLRNERDQVRARAESLFRETLPEVSRIVSPARQLQQRITEARELYGGEGEVQRLQVDMLAALSAAIPETLTVRITRLVAERGEVRVRAETNDFNTVDAVQRELEKAPFFGSAVISSANLAPRGGEVRFELKLTIAR